MPLDANQSTSVFGMRPMAASTTSPYAVRSHRHHPACNARWLPSSCQCPHDLPTCVTTFTPRRLSSRVNVIEARFSQDDSTRSCGSATSLRILRHSTTKRIPTPPHRLRQSPHWTGTYPIPKPASNRINAPENGLPGNGNGRDPVASTISSPLMVSSDPTGSLHSRLEGTHDLRFSPAGATCTS